MDFATQRLINTVSFTEQVKILVEKRVTLFKRDRIAIICEIFLPFVFVLVGSMTTTTAWVK